MEKKQPNLDNFFKLPNPGLRAYFQRTVSGNPDDYRPPFWQGQSREEVLSEWQKVIDALGVQKKYPSLYEFEMDMKSKVGPMSIQLPLDQRIESIEQYYTRSAMDSSVVPLTQEAIDATIKFFGRAKGIRLRSPENTAKAMRLSTNSGNPWFTKRSRVIDDALNASIQLDGDKLIGIIRGVPYELAAILGWRGQEGGIQDDDVKQRVIWMMSLLLNLHELRLYQPMIQAMQRFTLIPAYVSMEAVDQSVTKLFATKSANDDVICTDFTKFDQSFNPVMQDAARQIETALCSSSSDILWWFNTVFPAKFKLPLICSEDLMFTGNHGMGSGSGGTNMDESLAHKALQFEACQKAKTSLNQYSMAYGDDGCLTAPHLSVDDVIQAYESHGLEMNPSKQYVSKHDCVVLRRWHSDSYLINNVMVGVYSTFRALGRLLAQERFYDPEKWNAKMVELRAWSILENCNNSPYFEEFVQFCMKGDKYRLGLDLPGFMESIVQVAMDATEMFPDFLGYTKSLQNSDPKSQAKGITQWRIYKYLTSLK